MSLLIHHIQDILLKWYVLVPILLVVLKVFSYFRNKSLSKKLGAKTHTNYVTDGFNGFLIPKTLIKYQKQGTYIAYLHGLFSKLERPDVATFIFRIFGKNLIITRDPENIKAMLATQFNDFGLGLPRHTSFNPLLGDGIFTLDGEGWKHSRAMLRPQFARDQVAHVQALEPHIQVFAKHVRKYNKQPFDIQELFFRFTVDSATEFLFGESVGSLQDEFIGMNNPSTDFDGKAGFADAFNRSQHLIAQRSLLQNLYFLISFGEFRRCNAHVHRFADHYVQRALNTNLEELDKESKGGYVFLYELVKETRNPKVLRDQLLNILVAGRDTTAGLLSFAFYELSRNKEMWDKLKEEIYERFGSGEESKIEEITFESLKKCEYLKAVLNETLRVYPSVPRNGRYSLKDTTLPRGGGPNGLDPIFVPKHSNVLYCIYSTHRMEEFYGKDADVFRPERWFEPEVRKLGWAYLPFNGGPRICLGQQFALTEASYVVARLCQLFPDLSSDFNLNSEYPPRIATHLTASLQENNLVSLY
ncbi:cytochrome P450 alkane hydroxylase [Scheffersomyces coipomensis]|uniref:cytochrome P450 alkane hydroxylase n=1 Tax=Scheffersomyces coipomensis TaxID=1788519 RepID=UPI00315C7C75